ncbi:MAG: OmpH family outer membrane protein [Chitinophagales bacterium]|jgi:outer membrane protein|nr:OmpH family outer membrane protein [Chitinophagales bacterium]
MKKLFLILAATVCVLQIQAQKIATVNSSDVVIDMPETKAMQQKIQDKTSELSKQLETMYKDFEKKLEEYKKLGGGTKKDAVTEAKGAELQDMQGRMQKFEEAARKEVQELEQTLTKPIIDKAKATVDQVAKEKGYTHVFDVASGLVVVFPNSDDITNAVKTKLGITSKSK